MKIAIISTIEPFIKGGAKKQFESLYKILKTQNHEVDLFLLPFDFNLEEIQSQIQGFRKINIESDILITSRPMSYCIKHPNKITWFMHHISFFYEFSNSNLNPYLKQSKFIQSQQLFIEQDTNFLKESQKIYSISRFVANKLKKYNNIDSNTIYPFLDYQEISKLIEISKIKTPKSNFFFLPSLITFTKRQHLIIQSLLYTKNDIKLVLAGQLDIKYYKKYILPLIKKHKKIKENLLIINKFIEDEKYQYYSECIGTIFTPINEGFGYVVQESFFCSKPVITTIDSGGPAELVKNSINGLVVNPNPEEIAQAMDILYENNQKTLEMGKNAQEFAHTNFDPRKNIKILLEM